MNKKRLTIKKVRDLLMDQPMISNIEELLAVLGYEREDVDEIELRDAERLIERNKLRVKVQMKNALLGQQSRASIETLYKLIGDEDEINRLGVNQKLHIEGALDTPVIAIKGADEETLDKIRNL